MTSPIFAPRAQRELRAAAVWIPEDNPAAADAPLAAAMAAARRLQARPKLGRVRLELARIILCFVRQSRDLPGVLDL